MGEENVARYKVYYHYDTTAGDPPANAPEVPEMAEYTKNASVVVEPDLVLEGYDFSGWSASGITPVNNQFNMPTQEVHFYGYFTPKSNPTTYNVVYEVRTLDETNDPLPSWAIAPRTHAYEEGDEVTVDSTEEGIYDGYEFSGWLKRTDGAATNNFNELSPAGTGFVMPDSNVYIYGYYSRKSYTVTYQFEGSILPPAAETLLPEQETHYPGETVTTAANPTASGYRFLGWYKGATFKMPEENIDDRQLDDQGRPLYIAEDIVNFKVTLCNTADYEIHDVIIQEQLDRAKFTTVGATLLASGSNEASALSVTLPADSIIKINSIPAHRCGAVYSSYEINTVNEQIVTNTVEMIGALADNNYNLDTSHAYTASADFHIQQYIDPGVPTGAEHKNLFIFIGLVIIAVAGGGVVILNRRKS
jgi:hypothetical protein